MAMCYATFMFEDANYDVHYAPMIFPTFLVEDDGREFIGKLLEGPLKGYRCLSFGLIDLETLQTDCYAIPGICVAASSDTQSYNIVEANRLHKHKFSDDVMDWSRVATRYGK